MNKQILDNLTFLQNGLNEFITPNWKQNRTPLDFMVASLLETAELIDTTCEIDGVKHSTDWKWWKSKSGVSGRTTDSVNWEALHPAVVDNIKIELTDLLFFTLSQKTLNDESGENSNYILPDNDWVSFMDIMLNNLRHCPGTALGIILQLSKKIDFNIISYYLAKHLLNYYRQISKYGDGYEKIKNGKEDNELLHDIISDITFDQLENDFSGTYDLIAKRFFEIFKAPSEKEITFDYWKTLVSSS
jgi:dUTP pyrophosphatase